MAKTSSAKSDKKLSKKDFGINWSGLGHASLRFPLREDSPLEMRSEREYATFLLAWEAYRILDLLERRAIDLVDQYSKFRSREQFTEALRSQYFENSWPMMSHVDFELGIRLSSIFNVLHELKVALTHTDSMPFTVKSRIDDDLAALKDAWTQVRDLLESRYGWRLKRIAE